MEVWTLAWDDNEGTGCSVHLTVREANVTLIERVTEDNSAARTEAMLLLDSEDENDDLWEYLNDECFADLATYSVDSEKIEVPAIEVMRQALTRWRDFAKANGWTDADHHDADGAGWITMTEKALAVAGL